MLSAIFLFLFNLTPLGGVFLFGVGPTAAPLFTTKEVI
jgi:hypothetical protein